MAESGQKERAMAFLNKFKSDILIEDAAGSLIREMGELNAVERLIQKGDIPNMSASDKTAKLKEIRAAKIKLAEAFSQAHTKISERA